MVVSSADAQDSRLQPDFTFKRVTVPDARTGPRIKVQIDPAAAPATQLPAAPVDPAGPQPAQPATRFDWFWQAVSPAQAASGPGRLEPALRTLAQAPAGRTAPAPRLDALRRIAGTHGLAILRETVGTQVSPALVLAIIAVESSGRADAESHAGAQGLMQLIPATAARFGIADPLAPDQNIRGGVAYLDWLMTHFDRDPILVLAGYNAGEGAVRDHDGVPPYAETRDYIPKVLAAWTVARGLCRTPPQLVSDGCVFSVSSP